jgi:hypothetical protein
VKRLRGLPGLHGCWPLRAIRGARLDRNPLRRGIDRLETCLLVGLFVALAAVAPSAARLAGHACFSGAIHTRQEQLTTRHQVQAVLTQDASPASGYSLSAYVPTSATWISVTGVRHSGEVPAEPGNRKGTAVPVWTDGSGYLVSPPLPVSEIASQADAASTGVIVGTGILFVAGAAAIRHLLNRRRMAAWDADWVVTARMWNRQSW